MPGYILQPTCNLQTENLGGRSESTDQDVDANSHVCAFRDGDPESKFMGSIGQDTVMLLYCGYSFPPYFRLFLLWRVSRRSGFPDTRTLVPTLLAVLSPHLPGNSPESLH